MAPEEGCATVWDVCDDFEAQATPVCNSHKNFCTLLSVVKHHRTIKDIRSIPPYKQYETTNIIITHLVGAVWILEMSITNKSPHV